LELVALNITAEYMSINSELQLFRCIKGTILEDKIERSVYNKRKRRLFYYIEEIREILSNKFSKFTDVFIVDSTSRRNFSIEWTIFKQYQFCKKLSGINH
jgi:hypothetical protein